MFRKIVLVVCFTCNILHIKSSVVPVPVAPQLRYTLIAPQNIRPFAAQVSTFTKGLNVLAAPLAAGVLNPPAIFSKSVALPPYVPAPALLPATVAAPAVFPGPVAAPAVFPGPVADPAVFPGPFAGPEVFPGPVPASLVPGPSTASFVPGPVAAPLVPGPIAAVPEAFWHDHLHAASAGVIPSPAHVLPVPNAPSIHPVAPGAEPVLW